MTRSRLVGGSIALAVLLAGCAGVKSEPVDYDNMSGSGDHMAQGPGLLHQGDASTYDDGVRVYSNEPSKPAMIESKGSQSAGARPVATGSATTPAVAPTPAQQQEYREFQDYQQYKHFEQMPKDSEEYQRFRDWQEWKQYQQWRNGGDAKP